MIAKTLFDPLFVQHALAGRAIVHSTQRYENATDRLATVLLDLLSYAERDGKDFEAELELARKIFAKGE